MSSYVQQKYPLTDADFPVIDEVTLSDCVRGKDWVKPGDSLHGYTSFDLPLDSDDIRIFALGELSRGVAEITTSSEVVGVVRVEVSLPYHHLDLLDRARVCSAKSQNYHGVALLVSNLVVEGKHD